MIAAFPLQWPVGWPRTRADAMKFGRFGTKAQRPGQPYASTTDITVAGATKRVLLELERMGVARADVVISTNLQLRRDGLPLSAQRKVQDVGAAVYWSPRGAAPRVMAIDQYTTVEDNLAAIAATLDAMRAIERHGGAQILDRAFTGFATLPAPTSKRHWRQVLGFVDGQLVNRAAAKDAYRTLARQHHPDRAGGSNAAMSELNVALAEAEKEIAQ